MNSKPNKRTLKKRIRRIMTLCIFITILLFSAAIIFLSAEFFKAQGIFMEKYFSSSTAATMNSPYFLKQMGINGLEEFDPKSLKAEEWLTNLKISGDIPVFDEKPSGKLNPPPIEMHPKENIRIKLENQDNIFTYILSINNLIRTRIVLKGNLVYDSEHRMKGIPFIGYDEQKSKLSASGLMGWLMDFYSGSEVKKPLFDSRGNEIGSVIASMNPFFFVVLFSALALVIFFIALISLIIMNLISKFLTIPLINPILQLEQNIKALAGEDFNDALNKHIVLKKRPLREIESLVESTNIIMDKMKKSNEKLGYQKQLLETQNDELEAQNVELIESKRKIEEAQALLENQNNELEAQNEELIESKRQIEEAQTMLVQSENMASIGQLTAAITHEINTPLGAVNSNVQLSEMFTNMLCEHELVKSDEELAGILTQMKEVNSISIMGCQRVNEIIKSLKTFVKLDQAEFQEADIVEGIKSVLVLTSNLWKRKISIHEEYSGFSRIKCFSGLLNQVFMNIIVNAIQSIDQNGDIFIKTFQDENYFYVAIRDTGSGISEDHLVRIFDSGFTTKGSGIGMGLGLSICQNIVRKHRGEIKVTSEVGKGTEFIVSIPRNIEFVHDEKEAI